MADHKVQRPHHYHNPIHSSHHLVPHQSIEHHIHKIRERKRRVKNYLSIAIIILLSVSIIGLIYGNYILDKKLKEKPQIRQNNSISEEIQEGYRAIISDEKHWAKMPVTFNFSNIENCGEFQIYRIFKAISEIENATNLSVSFIQKNKSGEITFHCYKNFEAPTTPGLIQSGEASWKLIENEIIKADINFYNTGGGYYNGGCRNYPDVEIHEILHGFGFQHTNASYNIMNPVGSYCPTKINQDIIDKLTSIYE